MITDILKKLDIDAIILADPCNIRYFSGFTGEGYIVITNNHKFVITDSRYLFVAQNELRDYGIKLTDNSSLVYIISKLITDFNIKKIGFENLTCKYTFFALLNNIKGVELIKLGSSIDDFREIKSEKEIDLITRAIKICDSVFNSVVKELRIGLSERDVAAYIDYQIRLNGADGNSFDTIVASGSNTTMPHAVPGDKRLAYGDFVIMDFGCKYKGYCSDMTRTVFIGNPTIDQIKIYNIVKEAKDKAEQEATFGMTGKQIDEIARNAIAAYGYSKEFMHGTGHGVGLYIHEKPFIIKRNDNTVPIGSVFSIEPGIYIKDKFGIRIEDLCVMSNSGIKVLTSSDDSLICI